MRAAVNVTDCALSTREVGEIKSQTIGPNRVICAVLVGVAVFVSGCGGGSDGKKATPSTLLAAGLAAEQKGDLVGARSLFEQLLRKQPNNVYAHYNLGVIAQQQHDPATALQEYGEALASDPNYVPALYNEATIWGASNPTLAIATYRQIIKLQAQAPTAYLNLGLLEEQAGQHKAAISHLLTALHQDPSLVSNLPPKIKAQLAKASSASPAATPSPSASG